MSTRAKFIIKGRTNWNGEGATVTHVLHNVCDGYPDAVLGDFIEVIKKFRALYPKARAAKSPSSGDLERANNADSFTGTLIGHFTDWWCMQVIPIVQKYDTDISVVLKETEDEWWDWSWLYVIDLEKSDISIYYDDLETPVHPNDTEPYTGDDVDDGDTEGRKQNNKLILKIKKLRFTINQQGSIAPKQQRKKSAKGAR